MMIPLEAICVLWRRKRREVLLGVCEGVVPEMGEPAEWEDVVGRLSCANPSDLF